MKTNSILKKSFVWLAVGSAWLYSCRPDTDSTNPAPAPGANGFYVVNEGNFGSPNADISFVDKIAKTVTGQLFKAVNGSNIGNQAQHMAFQGDFGYVCVQAGGFIQVVNASDFKAVARITGPTGFSPRFIKPINNQKALVTDWGNNAVHMVNLANNTLGKTIPVDGTPEEVLALGSLAYVSLSGGFGSDNRIAVIDLTKDTVNSVFTVGDSPTQMVADINNKIWILCKGKTVYNTDFSINTTASTKGRLIRFNPLNNSLEMTFEFGSNSISPSNLRINGAKNKLYYLYGSGVFSMSINESALPTASIINKGFYGLSIDPTNENILGCDAGDYVNPGRVLRYTNTGSAIDTFTVHITPNNCVFR